MGLALCLMLRIICLHIISAVNPMRMP